jgi:hypothetical protein
MSHPVKKLKQTKVSSNNSFKQQIGTTRCARKPTKFDLQKYKWEKESNKLKQDRTKDLHPSIKNMIKNASAMERNKPGELCENFLTLYNSKMHGGLNIQLHQLFEDVRMGDMTFAKGISTNIWAGIFT